MELLETIEELLALMQRERIDSVAVQGINLRPFEAEIMEIKWKDCLFLGCEMSGKLTCYLQNGNYVFPHLNVPFKTYPRTLYSGALLYEGYDKENPESYGNCYDKRVYDYYIESVGQMSIKDSLAQVLHDHSITENLNAFLLPYSGHRIVAIMGGHALSRTDKMYRQVAVLSRSLTTMGYLMLSGGGPGAMEATHLGAWMAGRPDEEMDEALQILSAAPLFNDKGWLETAFEVMERFPSPKYDSLGIPTWHYGHELATPFATYIAKYFANSIREEGLLALAKGGIIYSPGSAGTMQEIFQDLAQNHYVSYEMSSPMIFLDKRYWTEERPVYPLLKDMSDSGKLNNILLTVTDTNEEAIEYIRTFTRAREQGQEGV